MKGTGRPGREDQASYVSRRAWVDISNVAAKSACDGESFKYASKNNTKFTNEPLSDLASNTKVNVDNFKKCLFKS